MPDANYMTVKIARGSHASPEDGASVTELTSMLAGEPFNDDPRTASRPIASFLRTYNDLVDDRRRRDLYVYAVDLVGSASDPVTESARVQRLIEWGDARYARRGLRKRRLLPSLRRKHTYRDILHAGVYAALSIERIDDFNHLSALALVDELIAMGSDDGGSGYDPAPVPGGEPEPITSPSS